MRSYSSIQFDFDQAVKQANELDSIADSLSNLSKKKFEDTKTMVKGGWEGESSQAYQGKCSSLQTKMDSTVSSVKSTAGTIRSVAKRIYDAEMEALRIALAREREAARAKSNKATTK